VTDITESERPKRIQRKRTKGWKMPPNTVYVGRPTLWGNAFRLRDFPDAASCVACYRGMRLSETETQGRFRAFARQVLGGKNLACWCPLVDKDGNKVPCHADVLLEIANG